MKIIWTRPAKTSLDHHIEYIAKENYLAANKFADTILSTVEYLRDNPNMARPGRVEGTRELVINKFPYIVVYKVLQTEIHILQVLHTSKKYP